MQPISYTDRNIGQWGNSMRKEFVQQIWVGCGVSQVFQVYAEIGNDATSQSLCFQRTLIEKVVYEDCVWFGHVKQMPVSRAGVGDSYG